MLTVKSTLIMELQNKIILSIRMMSSLIEMTNLSRHHIELYNTTIQWLRQIKPVLEHSSMLYEQMKFDLEEKLQEEVVILNANVEKMFPRYVHVCICISHCCLFYMFIITDLFIELNFYIINYMR